MQNKHKMNSEGQYWWQYCILKPVNDVRRGECDLFLFVCWKLGTYINSVVLFGAVSRIALVKPEKARSIEDMILTAVKRGALREKVTEERLIELLEQVNERQGQRTKVTIQRRRRVFDEDDEDDFE